MMKNLLSALKNYFEGETALTVYIDSLKRY